MDTFFRDSFYLFIIAMLIITYTFRLHKEHEKFNQKLDQIIQFQTQHNIEQK